MYLPFGVGVVRERAGAALCHVVVMLQTGVTGRAAHLLPRRVSLFPHRPVIVLIIRPRACLPTRVNPTTIYVQGPDISGPPYFDNMPTVESATDCIRTSLPRRGRFPHRSGWGEVVPSVSGGYDASCPRRVRSGTLCVVSPRSFTSGARCFTRSSARLTFAGGLRL